MNRTQRKFSHAEINEIERKAYLNHIESVNIEGFRKMEA